VKERRDGKLEPLLVAGGAGGNTQKIKPNYCQGRTDESGDKSVPEQSINANPGSSAPLTTNCEYYTGGAGFWYDPDHNRNTNRKEDPKCFHNGMFGCKLGCQKYSKQFFLAFFIVDICAKEVSETCPHRILLVIFEKTK